MRVALLTNFIPPYRHSLYLELAKAVGEMRIFLSTSMESNRHWPVNWQGLDVTLQRTVTFQSTWRGDEFIERHEVHVPYDTWSQLRRWEPDVIVTAEMGARSLQAAAFGKVTRTPAVVWATLSDRIEKNRGVLRRAARNWLTKNVAGFIVNGESGARYLGRFSVRDAQVLRIPYTTDMTALLELPLVRTAVSERALLYVGAISQRKGVDVMLEGIDRWAHSHPGESVSLILVGDGPLRPELQRRSLSGKVDVKWMGNVDYDSLPHWYQQAGVFVFPTFADEWGVVINEALAAGLPVLGSVNSQAVEELVKDGVNGWHFVPGGPGVIAEALDRLFGSSSTELANMRCAARASIRQITPKQAANAIGEWLAKIVHRID